MEDFGLQKLVYVHNKNLGVGERIARIASKFDSTIIRSAMLTANEESVSLDTHTDLGSEHKIATLETPLISKVKVSRNQLSVFDQLLYPLLRGFILGLAVLGYLLFFADKPAESSMNSTMITALLLLGVLPVVMVYITRNNIVWSSLDIVQFVTSNGTIVEFAVEAGSHETLFRFAQHYKIQTEVDE